MKLNFPTVTLMPAL